MGLFDILFGNKKEEERLKNERQAEIERQRIAEEKRIAVEREKRLAENRRKEAERKAKIESENSKKYQILDFYLDKSILNPCIGVDKVIKTYAADVKHLVSKLPYYERTVSHAKTAIRMTNLFRDDKLEESWENSEDYAILQEARDVLGL